MPSARNPVVPGGVAGESAVVDAFMDLYVAWRESSYEVDVVYRRWGHAASATDRRSAFAAFSRALDDEEEAARRFGEFASYAMRMLSA